MAKSNTVNKNKSNLSDIIQRYAARHFKLIPPTVLLVILSVGYLAVLKPQYDSIIREVDSENQKKSEQFAGEEQYRDNLILLQRAYKQIDQNDLARLGNMLPNKPEVEKIMVMLENISDRQYVKLDSLVFDLDAAQKKASPVTAGLDSERLKKLKINLDISGIDYRGLKKLLSVLENNLRLLDIDSVDFSPDSNSVNLGITAYYWESGA